jgi:hypothetical protein
MYTLYMMADKGDGNTAVINQTEFMSEYWHDAGLLFEQLGRFDRPAMVHFEPDFWGYLQMASSDPTKLSAQVKICPLCTDLPDDATGLGRCLVRLARLKAPKTLVGFSPSRWAASSQATVQAYMAQIGAAEADFTVIQTLDRDAGCIEAAIDPNCMRSGSGWYWDETNTTSPNFREHLAEARAYFDGLKKPLVWWQTPLGVPSTTPGGTPHHYRDNRVHYFLSHPAELVAAGGLGVVFGRGSPSGTTISSDSGQFRTAAIAYFANPAPFP